MKLTDWNIGFTTGVSASRPSFPAWTTSVDSSSDRGFRGTWLSSSVHAWRPPAAAVEIGLYNAHGLRWRRSDDVAQDDVTATDVLIDSHLRELVPPRTIHPRELAVGQQTCARIVGVHDDHWAAVFIADARRDERQDSQRPLDGLL